MALFGGKGTTLPQETISNCKALAYYTVNRLWFVVNYHRIMYTVACPTLLKLTQPNTFPGIEQFKFKIDAIVDLYEKAKKQDNIPIVFNFDYAQNLHNLNGLFESTVVFLEEMVETYGDKLVPNFDKDLLSDEHKETANLLIGQCLGVAYALDAEISKLELEYKAIRNIFKNIISADAWENIDPRYAAAMDLRYKME